MNQKKLTLQILSVILLISLALIERIWWDLGPNVELVTLVTFIAAFYLNLHAALVVAVFSLAISDIFLGNTNIAMFTWSAYLMIGLGAWWMRRFTQSPLKKVIFATSAGVMASLWFYLWTNFGVWLLDSFGMYSFTLNGLWQSYINGLPFLKLQLTGNLLILPVGVGLIETVKHLSFFKKRSNPVNLLVKLYKSRPSI